MDVDCPYPVVAFSQWAWIHTNNPSTGRDTAGALTIDSTGIYAVGYDNTSGDYKWRIGEKETIGWLFNMGVTIDSTGIYMLGWILGSGDR
jgi:hypothetical protein